MKSIIDNYRRLLEGVGTAAEASGRSLSEITLVAASKNQPPEHMQQLIDYSNSLGRMVLFGESKVQEWTAKMNSLRGEFGVDFIGRLQSNKALEVVRRFALIHSVHSTNVAEAVNNAAAKVDKFQDILLQVNISGDVHKAGFSPDELCHFIENCRPALSRLRCRGLMTITNLYENPADAQDDYRRLRVLGEDLLQNFTDRFNLLGDRLFLSMGMSADFEYAIVEGATHIRVGTNIFGER